MASTIQLASEAEKRIDSLVARTGRSKDFFLREIIKRGLEDVEDYYLAADLLKPSRGRPRRYGGGVMQMCKPPAGAPFFSIFLGAQKNEVAEGMKEKY